MRLVLVISALAMTAAPAMAETRLPVHGVYGSGDTCRLYKTGGLYKVVDQSDGESILISPSVLAGLELQVTDFRKIGSEYRFIVDDAQSWTNAERLVFLSTAPAAVTVKFNDDPPKTLNRCP